MTNQNVAFFGCALDSDEKHQSVLEKLETIGLRGDWTDPYEAVMALIREKVPLDRFTEKGALSVEDWLLPVPPNDVRERIEVEDFVAFMDNNGCGRYADRIGGFMAERLDPEDIPCLIGVDHSLTGGILRRLSDMHGPEELSLIVLDSHLDALTQPILAGAITFDIENNSNSVFDPSDPFIHNRPDSYNASSFLHFLLEEETILPENLYVLGISDYPPQKAFRIKDERIKKYARVYSGLKADGASVITKKELIGQAEKIRRKLARIDTSHVYVSIDMDIGSGNALQGVRFREWTGINKKQMIKAAGMIRKMLDSGTRLAGLDLMEFNPRLARKDRTYQIAAHLIEIILFGRDPNH